MTDFTQIKQLYGLHGPDGYTQEEIDELKSRLGVIPQVLEDYYLELGKDKRLNNTQDFLIKPEEYKNHLNEDYLIFYAENQYACVWGIKKEDLSVSNPPVYISYDQEEWKKETHSLTDFFQVMAYSQAMFSLEYSLEEFLDIEGDEVSVISQNFKNIGVKFNQWLGIDFYFDTPDSDIAVMENTDCLIYAAGRRESFEKIEKIIENSEE